MFNNIKIFLRISFFLCFVLCARDGYAAPFRHEHIYTTKTLDPLISLLPCCTEKTLVIFDINGVLVKKRLPLRVPEINPLPLYKHNIQHDTWIIQKMVQDRDFQESMHVYLELRFPYLPTMIHELQQKHVPVIALTNSNINTVSALPWGPGSRLAMLQVFDYHFERSFPKAYDYHAFAHGQKGGKGHAKPCCWQGVVFTQGCEKGKALASFLACVEFQPTTIIFVDDHMNNIESVKVYAAHYGCHFYGVFLEK